MINLKTEKEIALMAETGNILAQTMKKLEEEIRPGISAESLDRLAESLLLKYGGCCSFKGYQDFPACLCVSLNNEIVHAPPSGRLLKEGDIVSLDLGFFYQGFHSDMAVTVPVGRVDPEALRLIEVTEEALKAGIAAIEPGKTIGNISQAIQTYVEKQGFSVIRDLCGHGIGKALHEEPEILNYGKKSNSPEIRPGMVFCLEPMVSCGSPEIVRARDGFTFKTVDNSLSAHFEHTVAVTEKEILILTQ